MATAASRRPPVAAVATESADEYVTGRYASVLLGMNQFSFLRTALWKKIGVLTLPGQSIKFLLADVLRVKAEFDEMKKTKA